MQRLPRVTLWSSAEVTRTIPAVLLVDGEVAAHSAVRADGVGPALAAFVPGPGPAHVIFGLEHQSACGTDADAVTAIDTSRVGRGTSNSVAMWAEKPRPATAIANVF